MPQLPHIPNEPTSYLEPLFAARDMQAQRQAHALATFTRQHLLPCPYRRPSWRPPAGSADRDVSGRSTYRFLRGTTMTTFVSVLLVRIATL